MEFLFRFIYPYLLYVLIPLLMLATWYRWYYYRPASYTYPLTEQLKKHVSSSYSFMTLFFIIRLLVLLILALLVSKFQLVDTLSKVRVAGIDIMLVLDVSGSMVCCDDEQDHTPRIDVAKREAIRFVERRHNDPIGLVIFGREAVSRCPLTIDKHILREIIKNLDIGVIDSQGTVLAIAMLTASNRLRHSHAKSKVMILLTDGDSTEEDSNPDQAIAVAQELGIKVYTIGVGSEQGGFMVHPQFGLVPAGTSLNKQLLQRIASETGGKFFEAKKPHELRLIYDQIDRLETTEHDVPVFTRYYDVFVPFIWIIVVLIALELFLSSFVWFTI